jgi:hypothetical protein
VSFATSPGEKESGRLFQFAVVESRHARPMFRMFRSGSADGTERAELRLGRIEPFGEEVKPKH